jgi:NAD(P)H dehydrogenase (quinone)
MPKVVVIYHSGYGHTQRMAQSVAEGAGAELLAIDADGNLPEGGWERWPPPMPSSWARPPTWAA